MHFNLKNLVVVTVIVGRAAAQDQDTINHNIKLIFDASIDGKVDLVEKVVIFPPYSPHPGHEVGKSIASPQGVEPIKRREAQMDAREALNALLGPRYYTCDPGWGYCEAFGKCCQEACCSRYGFCGRIGSVCCPTHLCLESEDCCRQGCIPLGAECCQSTGWCSEGNHCYKDRYTGERACCTDEYCTKYIDDYGRTVTATTSYTSTSTTYTTRTQYYSYIYTWYYYYYFWTYIVESVVTSTRTSTSTTLSVYTTGAAAASEYFTSLVSETTFPTPAAATTLASLAGSTKGASPTKSSGSSNGGGSSGGSSNSGGGSTSGALHALASSLDRGVLMFLAIGGGFGILAVAL